MNNGLMVVGAIVMTLAIGIGLGVIICAFIIGMRKLLKDWEESSGN